VFSSYGFEYTTYTCGYKDGMADLVANHGVKAVVMGMRRGDPYTGGVTRSYQLALFTADKI
jgi:hypothetical protein